MIEYRIVRVFFNCHPLQMIADKMEPRDTRIKVMDHLHPLAAPEFRSMIRAGVMRHRRLEAMRHDSERVIDRSAIWPQITIRNFFSGA